jgi:hypothetical protein
MQIVLVITIFLLGLGLVLLAMLSAIRTFVLPRGAPDPLAQLVFGAVRFLFGLRVRYARSYLERDQVMALFAPMGLILLLPTWLGLVMLGYAAMFWAIGLRPWSAALTASGSALFTLGFIPANNLMVALLDFSESTIGLVLTALLISYLPTMYGAFSRRETAVALLEVRAGSPPSAVEMILRYYRIHGLHRLTDQWVTWETWFAEIEETHTSLAALVFFRSPQPDRSWITAAGTILDTASLAVSILDIPRDFHADLCIRAGYLALRRIADFFNIPYNPTPNPDDPISISRVEFDEAYDLLHSRGVPLKLDRDQAWLDFAGWRVNYDAVLLALAALTMAPYAPWSSDRSQPFGHSSLRRWRFRV